MGLRLRAEILILMVVLVLPVFSLAKEDSVSGENLESENVAFAIDLYKKQCTRSGNISWSPFSISASLAIAYAGAQGNTRKQMASALRFSLHQEDHNASFESLWLTLKKLEDKGGVSLDYANSLWPQKGFEILPEYREILKTYHGASVTSLDYQLQPGEASQTINRWVEERTKGKIKDIIPPNAINSGTKMVLTNAICFRGDWEQKFEDDSTEDSEFFLSSDNSVKTRLMKRSGTFNYADTGSLQILEMSFAGGDLSMVALLPRERDGINLLEADLSSDNFKLWKNKMVSTKVLVHFPKFEITSSFDLSEALVSIGMVDAFSSKDANFDGIARRNDSALYLSSVIHKAFVEVNEGGTQASASTSIMLSDGLSLSDPQIAVFRADHPLIFLIQENQTGTILFMGRVSEPTKAER
jgi:serpin B